MILATSLHVLLLCDPLEIETMECCETMRGGIRSWRKPRVSFRPHVLFQDMACPRGHRASSVAPCRWKGGKPHRKGAGTQKFFLDSKGVSLWLRVSVVNLSRAVMRKECRARGPMATTRTALVFQIFARTEHHVARKGQVRA